ncbi:MAG: hypothetical protein GWP14_00300 [Actinobacteria bacterium]|nr:hypothetical protein [Actinomycetota bacterium]
MLILVFACMMLLGLSSIPNSCASAGTIEVDGKSYRVIEHAEDHPSSLFSGADRDRGYVVFTREDPTGIYPNSYPALGELVKEIKVFASPGEYEPISFAVYSLKDLDQIRVEVSNFVNEQHQKLTKEYIDVRSVTCWLQAVKGGFSSPGRVYKMVPELLEKAVPLDMEAKTCKQYWLTVHVPKGTLPGVYSGGVKISSSNAEDLQIPVELKVLPIDLPNELPYVIGCWVGISGMPTRVNKIGRYAWEEIPVRFKDMKEHGMNSMVWDCPDSSFQYEMMGVRGSGKLELDFTTDNKIIEMYKQAGFRGPIIIELSKYTTSLANFLQMNFPNSYYREGNRGSHCQPPVDKTPPEYIEAYKEGLRQMYQNAKENDWPEIIWHINDEPVHQGMEVIRTAAAQYKWAKEAVPEVRTFCTLYDDDSLAESERIFKMFAGYLDVRTTWPGFENEEYKQLNERMIGQGVYKECWIVSIELDKPEMGAFTRARVKSGLKIRKDGVTGSFYWHYGYMGQKAGGGHIGVKDGCWDPHTDFPVRQVALSYRSPDNSAVPTLAWEGIREGIDDLRYITALEDLISRASAQADPELRGQIIKGQKILQGILDSLPWVKIDRMSTSAVSNSQMSEYRRKIAVAIMDLSEALERCK